MESEKLLERKLAAKVKQNLSGIAIKLNSISFNGLPDRMCLIPGGRIFFVEVKTTNQKPRKIQSVVHSKLRRLGFKVYVIDSSTQIQKLIEEYESS